MGMIDDLIAQYGGAPQTPASGILGTVPALAGAQPPSVRPAAAVPASLSIPPAEPWIWLSPDGSVSYAGRQPGTSGSATPGSTSSPVSDGSNPLSSNALTLMALGAGIAQGGIGKGLQQAATAAEADRKQQAQRYGVLQTYDALTDAGVPRDEARAAIYDPRVMRAVATKYFGGKPRSTEQAAPDTDPASKPASGS